MLPSPTEHFFLSHHNPAGEAIKWEAAAVSVTGPTADTWDWKTQLKENAFSIPTAQADVREPFEEQERVMGLLGCAGDMRCVAFATLKPLQAQQHLISSQLEALSQTLLLLAENYAPLDQVSGPTDPPGFGW